MEKEILDPVTAALVFSELAKNQANAYTDSAIAVIPKGFVYKGAVNYAADLPSNAETGDCYTVLYAGTSGTIPDGTEYAWSGTEWLPIGPDISRKADRAENPVSGHVAVLDAEGNPVDGGRAPLQINIVKTTMTIA